MRERVADLMEDAAGAVPLTEEVDEAMTLELAAMLEAIGLPPEPAG